MADGNTVTTTVPVRVNVTGNLTGNATVDQAAQVIGWLTLTVGLPAIGLAIYTLKNLSKGDSKIPMHVMLLLISDIISFFSRPGMVSGQKLASNPTDFIFYFGVVTNVTLMLFIAQERHLVVAYPHCLGCCGSVRRSPAVTLISWATPFAVLALVMLGYNLWFAVSLLAPFPFLLFFAADSWRALICCRSNPSTPERRRAVWGIGAIWANYTLLYVPFILSILLEALAFDEDAVAYLALVSHLLLYLSPLVDPFLYIFMTKGFKEVLQALPCCRNRSRRENTTPAVHTVSESVETRL
ncbi:uncharacterized protein si:ch211-132e22.4 [Clinocottus analis]|uniref:uncharacterized protein si:ch211-132e22.4 n=1 Tax=Clinocottus analis TaxID=304258 RepID=UPI0035BF37A3